MVRKLKKEIRELVDHVENHGWRVEEPQGGGYLKALCPCGDHIKRIKFSPSNPRTPLNDRKWFERQPCWEENP